MKNQPFLMFFLNILKQKVISDTPLLKEKQAALLLKNKAKSIMNYSFINVKTLCVVKEPYKSRSGTAEKQV